MNSWKSFYGGELVIFFWSPGEGGWRGHFYPQVFFPARQPVQCDSLLHGGLQVDLWAGRSGPGWAGACRLTHFCCSASIWSSIQSILSAAATSPTPPLPRGAWQTWPPSLGPDSRCHPQHLAHGQAFPAAWAKPLVTRSLPDATEPHYPERSQSTYWARPTVPCCAVKATIWGGHSHFSLCVPTPPPTLPMKSDFMLLLAFLGGISWHGSPPRLQLLQGRVCANSSAQLTNERLFSRSHPNNPAPRVQRR